LTADDLRLTGDWIDTGHPATIESPIRSTRKTAGIVTGR
jgi:hypothetical protein